MYTSWIFVPTIIGSLLFHQSSAFWPFASADSARTYPDANAKRVAIIGAGPAGSSTAYYLEQFASKAGMPINITVFERNPYIGGRTTTVNVYGNPSQPVELGASIFVEINAILKNSSAAFGLRSKDYDASLSEHLGIWNGEKFVFQKKDDSWYQWDIAKLIWKYGLAPIRTRNLMRTTVGKFLKLYKSPFFPFRSLSDRALDLGLTKVTASTGEQFLTENKIGSGFATDIIQASTRVNYGQNLNVIHGLDTMVCMSIDGAIQIEGGNWQIFDRMVTESNATALLNTSVTSITKSRGKYNVKTSTKNFLKRTFTSDEPYDTVVLAAPLQFSNITMEPDMLKVTPDEIPYVNLHVTLFTSTKTLNPIYFNVKPGADMPNTILTTLPPGADVPAKQEEGVGPAGFFSISTLRSVVNPETMEKEYLYKIFSPEAVTSEFLSGILGTSVPEDLTTLNITNPSISWYYPHVWHSYPVAYPRVTFEEAELARGFYYTSGMESFISTMETAALMGMNVAQLIVDDYRLLLQGEEDEAPVPPSEKGKGQGKLGVEVEL